MLFVFAMNVTAELWKFMITIFCKKNMPIVYCHRLIETSIQEDKSNVDVDNEKSLWPVNPITHHENTLWSKNARTMENILCT